jgi:hypothetical protein
MAAGDTLVVFDPRSYGGIFDLVHYRTDTGQVTTLAEPFRALCKDAALPDATITGLTIRGRVTGVNCSLVVEAIRIWELPD